MTTLDTTGFTYSTRAPGAEGELRFNGTNSHVTVHTGTFVGNLAAFSVVVGFRTTTTARSVLYQERHATNGWTIFMAVNEDTAGDLTCIVNDDASVIGTLQISGGSPAVNDGKFHYAAFVQTSKSARELFFDGVSVSTNSTTIGTITMSQRAFGSRPAGSALFLNGAISEVMVYNRALSALEARMLYDSALQGHPRLLNRPSPFQAWMDVLFRQSQGKLWPFFLTPPQ
jgi:hypothetical protein